MCLGIPGKIVAIVDAGNRLATVDIAGVRRPVNIVCVLEPGQAVEDCVGDWVLVHAGFAMTRIDEREAEKTLELFRELGEVQETLEALRRSETGEEEGGQS